MGRFWKIVALLRDPRVRGLPRAAVWVALIYLVSPVDFVPEILTPVFGFLDDAVFLWLSFRWLLRNDPDSPGSPEQPRLGR
jgi:uncharacterized membrane protein YkvA (DUF1232 family)